MKMKAMFIEKIAPLNENSLVLREVDVPHQKKTKFL